MVQGVSSACGTCWGTGAHGRYIQEGRDASKCVRAHVERGRAHLGAAGKAMGKGGGAWWTCGSRLGQRLCIRMRWAAWTVRSASCGLGRTWGISLACNGPACVGTQLGGAGARPKGSGGAGYVRCGGSTSRTRGARRWGGACERWAVGTSSGGGHMLRGQGMPREVGAVCVHRAVAEAVASGTGASAAC